MATEVRIAMPDNDTVFTVYEQHEDGNWILRYRTLATGGYYRGLWRDGQSGKCCYFPFGHEQQTAYFSVEDGAVHFS